MKVIKQFHRTFNTALIPSASARFMMPHNRYFNTETTAKGTTDYFGHSGQSEMYRLYRPQYPLSLLEVLNNEIPIEKSKRNLAVDIACGTGILTLTLSKTINVNAKTNEEYGFGFNKVIGIDTSQQQLNKASEYSSNTNIEYKFEDIENTINIAPNSVDLVTIAQGLHWFDINKLLLEIKRIIKPDYGLFSVLGYGVPHFKQYDKFHEAFKEFYIDILGSYNYGDKDKHCYWNIDRKLVDFAFDENGLFVPNIFNESSFQRTFFFENIFMTEMELFGYFQSMSAYQTYLMKNNLKHNEDGDPLLHLRDVYRKDMEYYKQSKMMVVFPFFLLTMRK